MKFEQRFTQKQLMTLRQIMSPVMIQRMSQFGMSYDDLVRHVETSSKDNVFLKISRQDGLKSAGGHRTLTARQDYAGEEEFSSAIDRHSTEDSLVDHLTTQIKLENLPEKETAILTTLIDHLDERGYLPNFPEIRDQIVKEHDVAPRKVADVLKILHTFEPEGVGARNLKECLRIQVQEYNFQMEEIREALDLLIKDHLEDLADGRYEKITKSLGYDDDEIAGLAQFIRDNLNPNPASGFRHDSFTNHIVPSFKVTNEDGKLTLQNLEEEKGIQVSISEEYLKQLSDPNLDPESKAFLDQQLNAAKQLIETIQYRQENLTRLMQFIVDRQEAFFKYGFAYLEPLLQKEIAQNLEMAPSTVSRICSSKYVETPHGVVMFRNLCPRDHFGKTAIRLEKIVKDACERFPELSDQKLVNVLKVEHGIVIARRTITKYRLKSGTEASRKRKEGASAEPVEGS